MPTNSLSSTPVNKIDAAVPSRPEARATDTWPWWGWLLVALIGLLPQFLWGQTLSEPTYMDAYYYTNNGQRLADGFGFTEELIWQYLDDPGPLPVPSHTYWMPLPSLLAAGGYLLHDSWRGAQLPFWLLAGLLPLLTLAICRRMGLTSGQTWTAVFITASGGYYNTFYGQPASFAPFAWTAGGCLLALAIGNQTQQRRFWLLAGIFAGLGHLTRADGLLLLIAGATVWVLSELVDWWIGGARLKPRANMTLWERGQLPIALLVGYLLVMSPWFWRNFQLTGEFLGTSGTQTIFLTEYNQIFSYNRTFDAAHFLSWGWGNILRSKLQGVWIAILTFMAINSLIFLLPFVLIGWWHLQKRQWRLMLPFTIYTLGLYSAMSLVFTLPAGRGGIFHSSSALVSWTPAFAALGIALAVQMVARRLSHWNPQKATPIFSALFVVIAFILALGIGLGREEVDDAWGREVFTQIGELVPETAVIMVSDPPDMHYHTGLPAIMLPTEPVPVILEVAERYGATHLVLDPDHPPLVEGVYDGTETHAQLTLLQTYEEHGIKLYKINLD